MPDWRMPVDAALRDVSREPARLAEIRDELAADLDDRYHARLSEGMAPADAERSVLAEWHGGTLRAELARVLDAAPPARADFGSPARARVLSSLWRDIRYGFRQLRLSPGFTAAALLFLALGIGANTALFELLDAVRLRMLPVARPADLAAIRMMPHTDARVGHFVGTAELTTTLFEAIRSQQRGFEDVAGWSVDDINLNRSGDARYGRALLAGGNLFAVLGVRPVAGRLIAPSDDRRGCGAPPAVVSYGYWQRELGGGNSAIGEAVWVNHRPFPIAGVMPPNFFGLEVGRRVDVALPLCAQPLIEPEDTTYNNPIGWWLGAIGRVRSGWTIRSASDQLAAISPAVMQSTQPPPYNAAQRSAYARATLGAMSMSTGYSRLRAKYDQPFWLLLGIAALVLLISCANLANLMLARSAARAREMAVRLALGASRGRLLRQLLAENFVLSATGAILGAALAQVLSRALVPLLGGRNEHLFVDLHMDWRVLTFTAVLALATCMLFGLSPAVQASRVAPGEAARTAGRGIVAPGSSRVRRVLMAAQIALSLTLVMSALLFVRTFRNLLTVDAGFKPEGVIVATVDFSALKVPPAERLLYKQQLTTLVARIPGAQTVARTSFEPVNGGEWNEQVNVPAAATHNAIAWVDEISPGYFAVLQNALVAGRNFDEHDTTDTPKVAIISRAFATKLFHESAPLGKPFGVVQYGDKSDVTYEVVGVAADLKYRDLRTDFEPIIYLPDTQSTSHQSTATLMVRSDQSPDTLIADMRHTLLQTNPHLVIEFSQLKDDIADGVVAERLMAMLAGFFGALAIVLAAVGLYGVIAYSVARRTSEIGMRMALGATARSILLLVMKEVAGIAVIGLLAGLALTLAVGPFAQSLLFGLRVTDLPTLVAGIAAVGGVACVATLLPALRASTLEPLAALRDQ